MRERYDPPDAERITGQFRERREALRRKRVVLKSVAVAGRYQVVRPSDGSRFFPEGRRRAKANIRRRLGRWYNCPGVVVTLTYDPKRVDQDEAWYRVGRHRREFLNRLNLWRRRHGFEHRSLGCIVCLEPMAGTGYPHLHLVFPNLRFLAPLAVIDELWAHGLVQTAYRDGLSPVSYACKYISKMEGWDDLSLAYISMYRLRIYSISRRYYLPAAPRPPAAWLFWCSSTEERVGALLEMIVSGHPAAMICMAGPAD